MSPADVHPSVAALSEKFILKNIGISRLSLNPTAASGREIVSLNPGDEVVLNGFEIGTIYAHSIRVFRDCAPAKLEMRKAAVKAAHDPEGETKPEEKMSDSISGDEQLIDDEKPVEPSAPVDVTELKAKIKELEKEYRADSTDSDRKQEIKKEITDLRKAVKNAKA